MGSGCHGYTQARSNWWRACGLGRVLSRLWEKLDYCSSVMIFGGLLVSPPFSIPLYLSPAVQGSWRLGCLSSCWQGSYLQWPWPLTSGDWRGGGTTRGPEEPCRLDVGLTFQVRREVSLCWTLSNRTTHARIQPWEENQEHPTFTITTMTVCFSEQATCHWCHPTGEAGIHLEANFFLFIVLVWC